MFHNEKFELTKIDRSQFKNDKLYYTKIWKMKEAKITKEQEKEKENKKGL
jgi:hypothetical protein